MFQLFKFTSYTLGYVVLDNRPAIEHTKHSCSDHSNSIWSHLNSDLVISRVRGNIDRYDHRLVQELLTVMYSDQYCGMTSQQYDYVAATDFIKHLAADSRLQIGLSSVLRPRQHSIGYMGDSFYR